MAAGVCWTDGHLLQSHLRPHHDHLNLDGRGSTFVKTHVAARASGKLWSGGNLHLPSLGFLSIPQRRGEPCKLSILRRPVGDPCTAAKGVGGGWDRTTMQKREQSDCTSSGGDKYKQGLTRPQLQLQRSCHENGCGCCRHENGCGCCRVMRSFQTPLSN